MSNPALATNSPHRTRPASSSTRTPKQTRPLPQTPPLTLHPTATLSPKATLTGTHPITVAASAVVHPFVLIDSSTGPVEVGEGAVLWEQVVVGSSTSTLDSEGSAGVSEKGPEGAGNVVPKTVLGKNVVVEANAIIEPGVRLGDYCIVEVGARVGVGAVVGEYTHLTPLTALPANSTTAAYTVLYFQDSHQHHRINISLRDNARMRELQLKGHEMAVRSMRTALGGTGALR